MKAKKVHSTVCAAGSQNIGPGRIANCPGISEKGGQREVIIIQSPAPAVTGS